MRPKRVIKAVLFDLDGTLLDSAPDLVATLNHLRASLGLAAMPLDHLRHFVSRGAPGLIKAGMPPCDDETLAMWRASFIEHYQQNSYIHSRPFDGVESMLSELAGRKIPWGIVTSKVAKAPTKDRSASPRKTMSVSSITGTSVPAGRYLVEVEANSNDGGRARGLAGLGLR